MMKTTLAAAAAACLPFTPAAAIAQPYTLGALKIDRPWSPPAPPGAFTAAAYVTVTNTGKTADRLIGVATPVADHAEIHRMSMDGGIMRMRPVPGGLAIDPGKTLTVSPAGGYHLMLIGPKRAFAVGDHFSATLRFAHAGTVKVQFQVRTPGAMPMDMH